VSWADGATTAPGAADKAGATPHGMREGAPVPWVASFNSRSIGGRPRGARYRVAWFKVRAV
jgi:hypothetical protein